MKISMRTMAIDSFVPMLESLSACLDKGETFAKANGLDLVNAKLAPDMYTLAQQVQLACHHANDCTARLMGHPGRTMGSAGKSMAELKAQIAETQASLREVPAGAIDDSEERDCSMPTGDNAMMIELNGLQLLRAWALPHFYFHVVTAFDILRNNGVAIGKQDYLSQIGAFVRSLSKQRRAEGEAS
jgi:uncharacterized protein